MGIISKVKSKIKDFLTDKSVTGKKKTTLDYFIEEVGAMRQKSKAFQDKYLNAAPENVKGTARETIYNVDPMLGTGAIGKNVGRVLREAVKKGVSSQATKKIIETAENKLAPLTDKAVEKTKSVVTKNLSNFVKKQEEFIKSEATKRNNVINKVNVSNPPIQEARKGEFLGRHNQPLKVGDIVEQETMFGPEKVQIMSEPVKDHLGHDIIKVKNLNDSKHPTYGVKKGAVSEADLDYISGKDDMKYFDEWLNGNGKTSKSQPLQEGVSDTEIKKVAGNILKNNPNEAITQRDAEAMAKDVIENRKYNSPKVDDDVRDNIIAKLENFKSNPKYIQDGQYIDETLKNAKADKLKIEDYEDVAEYLQENKDWSYIRQIAEDNNKVVKVRQRGNGTIKITKGELDTIKNIPDLNPKLLERRGQNPIRVFEEMGSEAKELFYRPIKVAEKLTVNAKNFWNKELGRFTKGISQQSSKNIMLHALSQESDGAKILTENGLKAKPLTTQEKGLYDYMRLRYDAMLDELNQARAVIGKEPIKKRDNYFTHIRDMNILEELGFNPVNDDIETLLVNKVHRNASAFGWAKKRTGSLKDVELDALNVFRKYQEKAQEHINMSPAITKLRELTRTKIPDTGSEKGYFKLQETQPRTFKYVQEWLDTVAGQKPPSEFPKVVNTLLLKLNQNIAFATLAGNVKSAWIQPTAIINTITEIGPAKTIRGLYELAMGGGDFALEKSNVLRGRQFETAIQDMANGVFGKVGRIKKGISETMIKYSLQALDSLTAQATWLGAYDKAKNQLKLVGEEAYNYADDIVTKTQASAAKSDIAPIQRTDLGKMLTLFQTFVINDFNRIVTDVVGIGTKMPAKERIKKTLTYLTAVSLANYFIEDKLGIPTPFPRPIKALKESGVKEAGKELAGQLPIVGGSLRYGGSPMGALSDLGLAIIDKSSGKYTSESWWEIAGKVLGVPGTVQLKKTIKAVEGLSDGYTVTYNKRDKSGNLVKDKNGETIQGKVKIKITDPIDKIRALLFGLYETQGAKKIREEGKQRLRLKLQ